MDGTPLPTKLEEGSPVEDVTSNQGVLFSLGITKKMLGHTKQNNELSSCDDIISDKVVSSHFSDRDNFKLHHKQEGQKN